MKKIAYIHFSDLHIGQKYANQYLSNAKDIVLQDLEGHLHNHVGLTENFDQSENEEFLVNDSP